MFLKIYLVIRPFYKGVLISP